MVQNNIVSGLSGMHENMTLSTELIEDAIINERLAIIEEYRLKGLINLKDLAITINCINIDCDTSLERCGCNIEEDCPTIVPHFEVPQYVDIIYIGSNDKQQSFSLYKSIQQTKYRKYKKRGKNRPYVWIDNTPNKNGMYDGFVFNAPLLSQIAITAVFKDPRQLKGFTCCSDDTQHSFIDADIVERVSKKLLTYYRQLYMAPQPNNQTYTPG